MENQKFYGEEHRKGMLSIDLYNIMFDYVKKEEKHPERLTMCKVLKERGDVELLYSLLVNTKTKY